MPPSEHAANPVSWVSKLIVGGSDWCRNQVGRYHTLIVLISQGACHSYYTSVIFLTASLRLLCALHRVLLLLLLPIAAAAVALDPPLNQDIEALAATVSGAVLAVTSPETVHTTVQAALAATRPPSATAAPALTAPGGSSAAAGSNSSSIGNRSCCPGSKVATVIFPHDITWTPAAADAAAAASEVPAGSSAAATGAKLATATAQLFITPNSKSSNGQANLRLADSPAACKFMAGCAAALQQAPRGRAAVLLGGAALLSEGETGGAASAQGAMVVDCSQTKREREPAFY